MGKTGEKKTQPPPLNSQDLGGELKAGVNDAKTPEGKENHYEPVCSVYTLVTQPMMLSVYLLHQPL